jgi:hypothetical protein
MSQVIVLYDKVCPVCRVLANLMSDNALPHWVFKPWQDYPPPPEAPQSWREPHPSELRVTGTNGIFLEGEAAWAFLIAEDPRLKRYQNIAAKIGVTVPSSARWLRMMGHGIRNLCFSCRWNR